MIGSAVYVMNIRLTRIVALVGLLALLIIALATLVDVVARWAFASPIAGVYDLSTLFIAVAMAACFPAALASRHNIRATFFADLMPVRVQKVFEAIAELFTLAFFSLLAWQLVIYCQELIESGETSFILEVPIAPWWIVATVLFLLCIPVQAIVALGAISDAVTGKTTLPAEDEAY